MARKARKTLHGEKRSYQLLTHLGSKRTLPVKTFEAQKVEAAVKEHLAELESKLKEHLDTIVKTSNEGIHFDGTSPGKRNKININPFDN